MITDAAYPGASYNRSPTPELLFFALPRAIPKCQQNPNDALDGTLVAAVYARLGVSDTAVRWLEATLPQYASVRGLLLDPRLRLLRGTPAFERFLKAHPE